MRLQAKRWETHHYQCDVTSFISDFRNGAHFCCSLSSHKNGLNHLLHIFLLIDCIFQPSPYSFFVIPLSFCFSFLLFSSSVLVLLSSSSSFPGVCVGSFEKSLLFVLGSISVPVEDLFFNFTILLC